MRPGRAPEKGKGRLGDQRRLDWRPRATAGGGVTQEEVIVTGRVELPYGAGRGRNSMLILVLALQLCLTSTDSPFLSPFSHISTNITSCHTTYQRVLFPLVPGRPLSSLHRRRRRARPPPRRTRLLRLSTRFRAMTFAALRSLYALIGDALDDIERIYRDASLDSSSPTPATPYTVLTSPCTPYRRRAQRPADDEDTEDEYVPYSAARTPKTPRRTGNGASLDSDVTVNTLDFPSLDMPYYPTEDHDQSADAAESLASHPDVIAATNRIVAACGQISATVHRPFLTLCDAAMGVSLSSLTSQTCAEDIAVSPSRLSPLPRGLTYCRATPSGGSEWHARQRVE